MSKEENAVDKLTSVLDVDYSDVVRRLVVAAIEGTVVVVLALYLSKQKGIPTGRKDVQHALMLGLTAAVIFSLLDYVSMSLGSAARQGAGFVIGANVAGGLM